MGAQTAIQWTDSTWAPMTGCTKLSAGCDRCYAESIAHRFTGTKAWPNGFGVTLHPERLDIPMRWRKTRRIFVCSTGDLFHDQVPDDYIAHVFAVMQSCAAHIFQVLTKRHARMRSLLNSAEFWAAVTDFGEITAAQRPSRQQYWPNHGREHGFLPNVWLGVSAENQQWFDIRSAALRATPAAVKWISAEPLLGPIHDEVGFAGIDWLVTGGESGPGARPMDPQWARDIRDQCRTAGVAFLHKQNGEWATTGRYGVGPLDGRQVYGSSTLDAPHEFVLHEIIRRVGRRAAGRELDGRTWDEFPEPTEGPDNAQPCRSGHQGDHS